MMREFMLEVSHLKKYFPISKGLFRHQIGMVKAVDDISFGIRIGEVLGMVGESGCGKSTAARAAIRLIPPTAGEVTFCGKNLLTMTKSELKSLRTHIQMIFQDPYASLNPRKNVADSIGEALIYHRLVATREEALHQVEEILKQVGLPSDAMSRYPHAFSGGQQQRICIGRAIALRPNLIVCDEAVSALDVSIQAQILNLLQDLKTQLELSYLFISHDLSVIRHISDRVLVLYLGKVMETASVEELFHNPKHPYTQALLSATPKNHPAERKKRMVLHGEIPSPANPPSGCPFRTRCPYAKPECSLPPPQKKIKDRGTGGDDHEYYCIL